MGPKAVWSQLMIGQSRHPEFVSDLHPRTDRRMILPMQSLQHPGQHVSPFGVNGMIVKISSASIQFLIWEVDRVMDYGFSFLAAGLRRARGLRREPCRRSTS